MTPRATDCLKIQPLDPSAIEALAPLWRALLDHVAALPGGAGVPVRPFEQSWPMERRRILEALPDDAFVLVARRNAVLIGYAFVVIEEASSVWYTGEHYAEVAHLCVAPKERGCGVGGALLEAVDEELQHRGIDDVQLGVDRGNDGAIRFYERRGYRHDYLTFYGSPGRKPWACRGRDEADRKARRGRYAPPPPDTAPDQDLSPGKVIPGEDAFGRGISAPGASKTSVPIPRAPTEEP